MKTITIELYSFDELSKDVQAKVLEANRYINVDYDQWAYFIENEWIEKLEGLGFMQPKIYFSGFSSQGDGACFTCSSIDFAKFMNGKYKDADVTANITHSWRYYFATSTTVNVDGGDISDELYAEIEEAISTERERLGNDLYRELERAYDSMTSDESVKEAIKANEYTFEANGKMRNA